MDKLNNLFANFFSISITLKKELFRKTIHISSAFIPFFYFYQRFWVITGLLLITLIYFASELLRIKKISLPLISQITEFAARTRDEGKVILGPITLVVGIFLAFTLFDYRTAVIAIFALSFGDGVASLFGKLLGGPKIPLTFGKFRLRIAN